MSDATTDERGEISHPRFARLYDLAPDERILEAHRDYLVRNLSGRLLDLGAGTGSLFSHVAEQAARGEGISLAAIEPDPHMRRRAAARASELGLEIDLRDARAESLPFPDDSFDAVVASVVFCTIGEPEAAVGEVARVLKPGGEFRFLEHVHADGPTGRLQDLINPVWARAAGGCQLNRDTLELFVSRDAFDVVEIERLDRGLFPATPFVRGRLRRRR
ncbi:class I SAM-dependent methyltransferase [Saliphagus sp. LR7]|uniref:class I SAM-dependent methyltransferase n=1 Tax=Saliphagus sp. LR7 TaxID=2282654 RepID=UPI000DF86670|nr:class I SAM-dependent methyltransferase [Saliphagus sp. LR7]